MIRIYTMFFFERWILQKTILDFKGGRPDRLAQNNASSALILAGHEVNSMGSKNHWNLGHRVASSFHVNCFFWITNSRSQKSFIIRIAVSLFRMIFVFIFHFAFFFFNCGGVDLSLDKRSSDFRWASAQWSQMVELDISPLEAGISRPHRAPNCPNSWKPTWNELTQLRMLVYWCIFIYIFSIYIRFCVVRIF